MRNAIGPLLIILSMAIGYAVSFHYYRPRKKTRQQLKRELEHAEKHHLERRQIRKLFVQATTEQIKRECA